MTRCRTRRRSGFLSPLFSSAPVQERPSCSEGTAQISQAFNRRPGPYVHPATARPFCSPSKSSAANPEPNRHTEAPGRPGERQKGKARRKSSPATTSPGSPREPQQPSLEGPVYPISRQQHRAATPYRGGGGR